MTTSISRGSAQILEFPARGRFVLNGRDEIQPRTDLQSQPLVKVASGSGWYHDAAIEEEAERSRNH
jgi:hypothetical protein